MRIRSIRERTVASPATLIRRFHLAASQRASSCSRRMSCVAVRPSWVWLLLDRSLCQGGLIRERFAPRLLAAKEGELLNADGSNLDPFRAWQVMMRT
jgi:hypothetical protein